MTARRDPQYPPLLTAYLSSRYGRDVDPPLRVGARHPGSPPPVPGRLHAQITACNPHSQRLDEPRNRERNCALSLALSQHGASFAPASSSADDGGWLEPGFWIDDIVVTTLDRLAAEFGQNACLIVDADAMIRLRLYRPDWRIFAASDPRLQSPA